MGAAASSTVNLFRILADPSVSDYEKLIQYLALKQYLEQSCTEKKSYNVFDFMPERHVTTNRRKIQIPFYDNRYQFLNLTKEAYMNSCSDYVQNFRNASTVLPKQFETMDFHKLLSFIDFDMVVGSGVFGMVCLGQLKKNNQKLAVKFIRTLTTETEFIYHNPFFKNSSSSGNSPIVEALITNFCSKLDTCFSVIAPFYEVTSADIVPIDMNTRNPLAVKAFQQKGFELDSSIVMFLEPFDETFYNFSEKVTIAGLSESHFFLALYSLYKYQSIMKGFHGDFHSGNCMVTKCRTMSRNVEFNVGNKKCFIDTEYRIIMTDFGFARSDLLFGRNTSARHYQRHLRNYNFIKNMYLPMNVSDIGKFLFGYKNSFMFGKLINYVRYVYKKVYSRIFNQSIVSLLLPKKDIYGEPDLITLTISETPIAALNTLINEMGYLPPEFKENSTLFIENILQGMAKSTVPIPEQTETFLYSERYDFTHSVVAQFTDLFDNKLPTSPFLIVEEDDLKSFAENHSNFVLEYIKDSNTIPLNFIRELIKFCLRKYGFPVDKITVENKKFAYTIACFCEKETENFCKKMDLGYTIRIKHNMVTENNRLYVKYLVENYNRKLDEEEYFLPTPEPILTFSTNPQVVPQIPQLEASPEDLPVPNNYLVSNIHSPIYSNVTPAPSSVYSNVTPAPSSTPSSVPALSQVSSSYSPPPAPIVPSSQVAIPGSQVPLESLLSFNLPEDDEEPLQLLRTKRNRDTLSESESPKKPRFGFY